MINTLKAALQNIEKNFIVTISTVFRSLVLFSVLARAGNHAGTGFPL